jgi:hypothetical protein
VAEIHLHGITPVVLIPGDKVLIGVREWPTMAQIHEVRDRLADQFPEVEFTFLAGVESVTVQRAEPADA